MSILSKLFHRDRSVSVQAPSSIPSNQPIPVTDQNTSTETQTVNNLAPEEAPVAPQVDATPMQPTMAPPAPTQQESPTQIQPDNNQNNPV